MLGWLQPPLFVLETVESIKKNTMSDTSESDREEEGGSVELERGWGLAGKRFRTV